MALHTNTYSAATLVAGTCIGAGMLAFPVTACQGGCFPNIILMTIIWAIMTMTALCLIEANLLLKKKDQHIMSMAKTFLGPFGQLTTWTLFIFISYASLIAYIAGCGHLCIQLAQTWFHVPLSYQVSCCIVVALLSPILLGPRSILAKVNSFFFFCMLATYCAIVASSISNLDTSLLLRQNWSLAYLGVPLLITAFSFHTIVPSIHTLVDLDRNSAYVAVIGGTTLALIVYVIWQMTILGTTPLTGPYSLIEAQQASLPATYCLMNRLHSHFLAASAYAFSGFALMPAFLGIGMGLYDFLEDSLHLEKRPQHIVWIGMLIFIPALIIALSYEHIFLVALDISGGFGDTILNCLIPILFVWSSAHILPKLFRPLILILLIIASLIAFGITAWIRL